MTIESNVSGIDKITELIFILRLKKMGIEFIPGEYILIGIPGFNQLFNQLGEYSIYSSSSDPYPEVLVKLIPDGFLSPKLYDLKAGDLILIDGPAGYFTLNDKL